MTKRSPRPRRIIKGVGGLTVVLVVGIVIGALVLVCGTQRVRQVHDEMMQVTWAPMSLVVRYAKVVLFFLVPVTGFVILLDLGFSHLISDVL
jgi:preprotein translocase SecE subunit